MFDLYLGVEKKIFKEFIHFFLYDLCDHALGQDFCPRCPEIYNFDEPLLGLYYYYHYYTLILPDQCLRGEKKSFKEKIHFHYMTHTAKPSTRTPAHGVVKLPMINFARPFLGLNIYILKVCLNDALE